MVRLAVIGAAGCILSACWAGQRAPLPEGPTDWEPIAGPLASSWIIEEVPTSLACPDGQLARLWIARPEAVSEPMPIAVVFHGGAFDYAVATEDGASRSWRETSRLSRDWADRRAWASIGMWSERDEAVQHTGALPLALAERDHAILAVPNCWGDYGFGQADNDTNLDGFDRLGGSLTRLAWRLATEEGFADAEGLELGLTPDTDKAVAVGFGQGGRSVGIIVKTSGALDPPSAIILDSVDDDLRVFYDDPGVWSEEVSGLDRIWTGGREQALRTRLGNANLPESTHLVLSAADPRLPAGITDELAAQVTATGGTVTDTTETRHIQLAGDLELARTVVGSLLGPIVETEPDTDSE